MTSTVRVELVTVDDVGLAEQLTNALRTEILDLTVVEDVSRASAGPAPSGTRGMDVSAMGELVVAIPGTIEAARQVFGVLRGWLRRIRGSNQEALSVTINGSTLTFTPTETQQEELFEAFLKEQFQEG